MTLRLDRAKSYFLIKDFENSKQDYQFVLQMRKDDAQALEGLKTLERVSKPISTADAKTGKSKKSPVRGEKSKGVKDAGLELVSSVAKEKPLSPEKKDHLKEHKARITRFFAQKNYADAEKAAAFALTKFPDDIDLAYDLSRAAYFQQKYSRSLKIVNGLISKFPQNTDYLNLRGHVHLADNNLEQAENDFKATLMADKSNTDANGSLEQIKEINISAGKSGEKRSEKKLYPTAMGISR